MKPGRGSFPCAAFWFQSAIIPATSGVAALVPPTNWIDCPEPAQPRQRGIRRFRPDVGGDETGTRRPAVAEADVPHPRQPPEILGDGRHRRCVSVYP